MAIKLIYIPNDDTQKYPFCRLQLVLKRLDRKKLRKPPQDIYKACLKIITKPDQQFPRFLARDKNPYYL